jgi:nitrate reductase delta subunit
MARRRRPEAQAIYRLCSALLLYPDDRLLERREEVRRAVGELAPGPAADALGRFADWLIETDPLAVAQHYVETIDLHKRSGLYLTFYGEGDKRERGSALLRLKQLYRAAGLPLEGTELPDYLPVMLEFAADAPGGRGELVLREHRAAIELVRLSLREHRSPYADVVEAVSVTLGALPAADRASVVRLVSGGPPTELVGLEPFAPPEVMPSAGAHR